MVSRARLISLGLIETTAIANSAVTAEKLSNITTTSIIEGANLYFTNTRAVEAFTAGQNITIEANGLISAISSEFTGNTDVVAEGVNNLYFTNARSVSALTAGQNITIEANGLISAANQEFTGNTDVVAEGVNNLYFTNARSVSAVENNISTTSVTEGTNLYFTNTRAVEAFTAGQNITIEANGLISAASQEFTGNTDVVAEGVNNLYFTNARVVSALSSGPGVNVNANGMIEFNTYALTLNSEVFTSNGSNTVHIISKTVKGNSSIILLVNGLSQIPGTDYIVDGNIVTLTSAAPNNAYIDVRYFSVE